MRSHLILFMVQLAQPPGRGISVHGHADTAGAAEYNQLLSERRAAAVVRALLGFGMGVEKVTSEALGETRPDVLTGDGVAEPKNRRVGIILR